MTRRSVEVPGLHHGGLPIPQACVVGNLLVSGGIVALDPEKNDVPTDTEAQVELVFANLRRTVEAAGGRVEDVVKCTVFVRDKSIRPIIDKHWVEMFPDETSRPARHTLRIDLPEPQQIQLEIMAVLGEG
ncbi:RidA family protein [Rhodococcus pseudokoreensis]|uniref:RidA family protein n=1 Tax=Rhodococcus pseudokoreensis TaxID=2811421 RepID=A0A974VYX3_9NOCA|nr:RidA family protein [Rhodococcus pseudokoreensis]QSE88109.1 RidA family protein [Rhodococcus pseudokoreensis]QSE95271.1 RidA family protein [Rhodococcus pseudokoreensis]